MYVCSDCNIELAEVKRSFLQWNCPNCNAQCEGGFGNVMRVRTFWGAYARGIYETVAGLLGLVLLQRVFKVTGMEALWMQAVCFVLLACIGFSLLRRARRWAKQSGPVQTLAPTAKGYGLGYLTIVFGPYAAAITIWVLMQVAGVHVAH
jgi:hypothetical protein